MLIYIKNNLNRIHYFEVSHQINHYLLTNPIKKSDFLKILGGEFVSYEQDETKFNEMIKFLDDNKVAEPTMIE